MFYINYRWDLGGHIAKLSKIKVNKYNTILIWSFIIHAYKDTIYHIDIIKKQHIYIYKLSAYNMKMKKEKKNKKKKKKNRKENKKVARSFYILARNF